MLPPFKCSRAVFKKQDGANAVIYFWIPFMGVFSHTLCVCVVCLSPLMAVLKWNFHFTVLCKFNRPSSRAEFVTSSACFEREINHELGAVPVMQQAPLWHHKELFSETYFFQNTFWKMKPGKAKRNKLGTFYFLNTMKMSNFCLHNVRPLREFKQIEQLPCVSRI